MHNGGDCLDILGALESVGVGRDGALSNWLDMRILFILNKRAVNPPSSRLQVENTKISPGFGGRL